MSHLEEFEYEGGDDLDVNMDGISSDDWEYVAEGGLIGNQITNFFERISEGYEDTLNEIQSYPRFEDVAEGYQYALDRFNDGYQDFMYLFDLYGGMLVNTLRPYAGRLLRCRQVQDFKDILTEVYENAPDEVKGVVGETINILNAMIIATRDLMRFENDFRAEL